MADRKAIGGRVRRSRRAQDITQEHLASQAGLAHSTLHRIEKGISRPNLDTLFKLAGALGVDPKWLLSGDEESGDDPRV